MQKKALALLLALAMIFALAACTSTPASSPTASPAASPTASSAASPSTAPVASPTATPDTTMITNPAVTPLAGAGQKYKIAVSLPVANNAWQAKMLQVITDEAAKYADQADFTIKSATSDDDQLSTLNIFKTGGYDLIIILPGNGTLLTPVCEDIYNAGIPTVMLDRGIDSDTFTAEVKGDNYGGGVNAANLLAEKLGDKGNIAVLRSYSGTPIDLERFNGFNDTITANYPDIHIIVQGDGQFDRDHGLSAMTNILPGYPQIDAVYAQDDEAALGALNAIQNAKRTDIKFITGFGGTKDTYALFQANDPVYIASMSYFPSFGTQGVDTAMAILTGQPYQKELIIPSVVVDASNVAQYMDDAY